MGSPTGNHVSRNEVEGLCDMRLALIPDTKSCDFLDAGRSLAEKSLVMRPQPDNLYGLNVFKDLIDKPVLDSDPAGISAREIPD